MRRAALGCVLALAFSAGDTARAAPGAPDKAECAASYEAGQLERRERRLLAAHKDLVTCASTTCPRGMQRECAAWLVEVERATPTVVVRARLPDGRDAVDVRVLVDGEEVATRLDGAALAIDPGERRFRFERPPQAPIERTLVVHEGDRLVPIDVALSGPPATRRADPPWAAVALGGLGAGALVAFALLGASGVSRYHELQDTCAPRCSESDTSALQTRFIAADISLGVGIAALAGAAVLVLTHNAKATGPGARSAPGRFTF